LSSLEIRPVNVDDIPALVQLDEAAFGPDAYAAMTLRQFYDIARPLFLVATVDDEVLGYGLVLPSTGDDGCFVSMVVAQPWRGKGLGHAMMTEMLNTPEASKFSSIWLTVDPTNTPAIQLGERFGFVVTKKDPHYFGRDKARWVMARQPRLPDS